MENPEKVLYNLTVVILDTFQKRSDRTEYGFCFDSSGDISIVYFMIYASCRRKARWKKKLSKLRKLSN